MTGTWIKSSPAPQFIIKMETEERKKLGKKSKGQGMRFELKVRRDLEEKGWIVSKWANNVDMDKGELVIAKSNRFNSRTTGFPDFMAYKYTSDLCLYYKVIGVESKMGGKLSKVEKEKCRWLLDNNVFGEILVASKSSVKRCVAYKTFEFSTTHQ